MCSDHIFIVGHLLQQANEFKLLLTLFFFIFERVLTEYYSRLLAHYRVPKRLVKVIEDIYKDMIYCDIVNGDLTDDSGVIPGGMSLPLISYFLLILQ